MRRRTRLACGGLQLFRLKVRRGTGADERRRSGCLRLCPQLQCEALKDGFWVCPRGKEAIVDEVFREGFAPGRGELHRNRFQQQACKRREPDTMEIKPTYHTVGTRVRGWGWKRGTVKRGRRSAR